jgi:hypothetical protein
MVMHRNGMLMSNGAYRCAYDACRDSYRLRHALAKNPYKQKAYRAAWAKLCRYVWAEFKDNRKYNIRFENLHTGMSRLHWQCGRNIYQASQEIKRILEQDKEKVNPRLERVDVDTE